MIEDAVTSFMDGRVRLRHSALKDAAQAEQVRTLLASTPGMRNVAVNSRTGSLLLEYDPAQISREDLLSLAGQWEAYAQAEAGPKRIDHAAARFVNRGMLATFAAALAFGFAGRGRVYVAAGGLFLLLNLVHLYTYRKRM